MGSDDYDASISSLENREEEFLREKIKTEQEIRQCLDKLAEGHPGEGDPQYEPWKEETDQWRAAAGKEFQVAGLELAQAGYHAADLCDEPAEPYASVRDGVSHAKEGFWHLREGAELWQGAGDNQIAQQWRDELKDRIDSLEERMTSLDSQCESLASETQELKEEIVEGQDDLLHDAQRQDELRELCNYASRLDGILRALGH